MLIQALNGEEGVIIPRLARRFGVADVLDAVKDRPFMASLLYYFGVLTLAGQTDFAESILNIPNLVARSLYVERLQEMWLDTYEDKTRIPQLRKYFCQTGDLQPLTDSVSYTHLDVYKRQIKRWRGFRPSPTSRPSRSPVGSGNATKMRNSSR